jgi:hypothetical protein
MKTSTMLFGVSAIFLSQSLFALPPASDPTLFPLPKGYYWVSCSDPAYSYRLDCDPNSVPRLSGMTEEQWQDLMDKRRCAKIKLHCLKMPPQKKNACLTTYNEFCN